MCTDCRRAACLHPDGRAPGRRATVDHGPLERALCIGSACVRRSMGWTVSRLLHRLAGEFLHRLPERPGLFCDPSRRCTARICESLNKTAPPERSRYVQNCMRTYILAPCSLKNLTAPGCHGIGEFAIT